MSFAAGIRGYAKRTQLSIDDAVISINTQVSTSIIKRTPVDTGRARSNWIATIGTPSSAIKSDISDSTNEAISTAQSSAGKVFYLTNNLPYIYRLEYDSWSTQAPEGMVRLSIQSIQSALRNFHESR